jgi:tetratricopeptide (TPR) repeat protein
MNLTDAAHMIRLQRDADRRGIRRRLRFNKEIKTRTDLASYVKKSKKVRNEDELLAMVPHSAKLPAHISYDDDVPSQPQTPLLHEGDHSDYWPAAGVPDIAASTWLNVPPAAVTPNHSKMGTPISSLSQRSSFSSFDQMDFTSSSVGLHPNLSHEQVSEEFEFEDEIDAPTTAEVLGRIASVGQSTCFEAATEEVLCPRPGAKSPAMNIFGYLSSTPLSMQYQTSCPVSNRTDASSMGSERCMIPPSNSAGTAGTPATQSQANLFLSRCFYACMCFGQSCEEGLNEALENLASRAIDEAMHFLAGMIQVRDGKTLSTLSILLAMFESLGQLELAQKLLRKALEVSKQQVGIDHALTVTIDWMLSVPDRSSHFKEFNTDRSQAVRESIVEEFGSTSESALVASYNVGWALLLEKHSDKAKDALRLDKAAEVLGSLRNQCEQTLGPHHLQTIMTSVTLARVYFYRGSTLTAETLIGEMIGRLEKVFQPLHPYLLEALRRQAKFLQKLGKRAEAEKILLRVVQERFSVLGPTNSRSKSSLEELRLSMIARGAPIDIVQLHRQIKTQCVKYEVDRKRQAYQWSCE